MIPWAITARPSASTPIPTTFFCIRKTCTSPYVEGTRKFIYNATANPAELYDIRQDPSEGVNLASQRPDAVREGRERLAAWVQYQQRFYQSVSKPAPRPAPGPIRILGLLRR